MHLIVIFKYLKLNNTQLTMSPFVGCLGYLEMSTAELYFSGISVLANAEHTRYRKKINISGIYKLYYLKISMSYCCSFFKIYKQINIKTSCLDV